MKKNLIFTEQSQFNALKVFRHMDRVCDLMKGKKMFPISVDLSVSNFCNQKCVWCYYRGYLESARTMLDKGLLLSLLRELSALGVKGINFTGGGEPLTHPALIEVMEYAHAKGIDVGLITNGVLLNKEKIRRLTRIAKFIRISLSSSGAKNYRKFHNAHKDDFKKLIENLKLLGEYSKGSKCLTGVLFLLEPKTQSELLDTIELVKKSGLKFFEVRLIKNTPCFTPGSLTRENDILYEKAKGYADNNFDIIMRDELVRATPRYGKEYKLCYAHEFVTSISAEGDVYVCCEFEGKKKYAFGNIKKKKFEDIWFSDERKKVVKNLDLSKCFACCKGDGINQLFHTLNNLEHLNFM